MYDHLVGRSASARLVLGILAAMMTLSTPAPLPAQSADGLAPGAPSWCRSCTRPTDPPFIPPVNPPDPNLPPGDGDRPPSGRKGLAAIGAAGLALAAGIPLGSALQPTLPFRPVVAEGVEVPPAPSLARADGPGVAVPLPVVEKEAAGVLAPDTASHLPLLLAIGIAAIAGGLALLRDHRRRRRRGVRIRG